MKTALIVFSIILYNCTFANSNILENMREGKSRYINNKWDKKISQYVGSSGENVLTKKYSSILNDPKLQKCATSIVDHLKSNDGKNNLKLNILTMRSLNLIDDITTGILLKARKIKYSWSFSNTPLEVEEENFKKIYHRFSKSIKNGMCKENAYLALFRSLKKLELHKTILLRASHRHARKKDYLDKKTFEIIESLRLGDVHKWKITLDDYRNKIDAVRRQAPITTSEFSSFVTKKRKKLKKSLRQHLYEHFNFYQIVVMGEIIKKMKSRLQSDSISIVISRQNGNEVIPLDPMEEFRFVLKMMRKELNEMNHSSIFENVNANFSTIIAAAYEVGNIPSSELEELATLEEIWNPKKSKLEKIMYWIRSFGGISAIFMPAPYGFVPLLAIMIIETVTSTPKPEQDLDFSLF